MDKDQVIYEFIDKCAYLACVGNIIIENYTMSDGEEVYKTLMHVFRSYLSHYSIIQEHVHAGELDEEAADVIIRTDINWFRQESFKGFVDVIEKCLKKEFGQATIPYDVKRRLVELVKEKPGYDIGDMDMQELVMDMRKQEEEFRKKEWEGQKV